jgi:hypothetical protein
VFVLFFFCFCVVFQKGSHRKARHKMPGKLKTAIKKKKKRSEARRNRKLLQSELLADVQNLILII